MIKRVISCLLALCITLIVVLLFRATVVSFIAIPQDGQRPVFHAGDFVSVQRAAYGVRLSPMKWWGYNRWGKVDVGVGEWVAFNKPVKLAEGQCIDEADLCIGCCYALPGDTVWVNGRGRVLRHKPSSGRWNGIEMPRKDAYVTLTKDNIQWYAHIINMHEGLHAAVIHDSLCVSGHFVSSYRFKQNYYWMASANPNNVNDSRSFGFVPESNIMGRLGRVIYSIDARQPWYKRWQWNRFMLLVNQQNFVEEAKHINTIKH